MKLNLNTLREPQDWSEEFLDSLYEQQRDRLVEHKMKEEKQYAQTKSQQKDSKSEQSPMG